MDGKIREDMSNKVSMVEVIKSGILMRRVLCPLAMKFVLCVILLGIHLLSAL
ncbi:hypothetical protein RchiOBHm_Chr3g0453761 [Rosa chinensis]|uniref:Uncharacterized protein n=1 Tax=Rosa chinensis TaxID=74649 RepID=A0A2P6R6M9_ROSCH|nr:hypothetical protein RchiOBHm_Chr3g0453741 [Rosa chinensis]PRQ42083.1 hypothetical protein RchiOBHm_Chr3g0453761 [Rosa chinensis]